jgi:shikimate dehydrogenase
MKQYGLIGHPLNHSFSEKYFTEKFKAENILDVSYHLFDIDNIDQLTTILKQNPNLLGLNVTIPYKESILPYLDEIDEIANKIGAVNTIKINNNSLKGFNTDYYGFKQSLPFINTSHQRALILGTGGASKAVHYVLQELNIDCLFVSRKPNSTNQISYNDVNEYVMKHHQIIVNTTPVGTHPLVDNKPNIPYEHLTNHHLLYDLVYNPSETLFLKYGKEKNCIVLNGLQMLELQAEKSWEIWND